MNWISSMYLSLALLLSLLSVASLVLKKGDWFLMNAFMASIVLFLGLWDRRW